MSNALTLLLGGARSGKSDLALTMARRTGAEVVFVATAQALDADMATRIECHQDERPAPWITRELPQCSANDIAAIADEATIIIDCLTLLTSNLMLAEVAADVVIDQAGELAAACAARSGTTIVITNEVGMGVVPATPMGREYRDLLGRVNRTFANAADTNFLIVAGQVLRLEPPPA